MKRGKLDTLIKVQREIAGARNALNEPEPSSWGDIAEALAEHVQMGGREYLANHAITSERRAVFRTDRLSDVRVSDRVVALAQAWNITEVRPLGRRFIELHCKAEGSA
ncbi:MAG: head-tail adaptor protein [Brevundimonas sp.]|jgi:head-tail adaptor|uniref:head-tail adaptor protein n=1 Tax=Brevundimonas sp. TaxID=1871086 RepID=UPI00391EF740